MKEINFHDGGMPIHLDDLKLLQSFSKDIVLLLIKSLVGEEVEAFAMNRPKVKRAPEGGVIVLPGAMYVKGDILSWNETRVADITEGMPIYACIREVTSDNRLFADGQEHPCRIEKEVYFSSSKDGVAEAYDITTIAVFADLLQERIKFGDWQNMVWREHFYNGYSGTFSIREVNRRYRVQAKLESNATVWTSKYEWPGRNFYSVFDSTPAPSKWKTSFRQGVDVKSKLGSPLGKLICTTSEVFVFEPVDTNLTPRDCPIVLDITL